jgi:hypothetical protein
MNNEIYQRELFVVEFDVHTAVAEEYGLLGRDAV